MFAVKREDKKYWDNPVVYLCSADPTEDQDSCEYYGEAHQGPHFILHQWRATDGLNRKDIKHLKIAGTLKYKVIKAMYSINKCVDEIYVIF